MTCLGDSNQKKIIRLGYFRISEFWYTKNQIKFRKYGNLVLYPLNFKKIYKIQDIQISSILFIIFILLYSQRNMHHWKYYI